MTIVVYTAPSVEPLTLTEAKLHCRVDTTDDDTIITSLIIAARQQAEQELRRYLITQTLDGYFDSFPCRFTLPPLQTVSAITYYDTDGVEQTLAADQYRVDATSTPARIEPAYGVSWPSTRNQSNAVKVRFVSGYGLAVSVPAAIKAWMLLNIALWYDNRAAADMKIEPLPYIGSLLDPFRVMSYL